MWSGRLDNHGWLAMVGGLAMVAELAMGGVGRVGVLVGWVGRVRIGLGRHAGGGVPSCSIGHLVLWV